MKSFFKKSILVFFLSSFSLYCFSQREGQIALGVSLDYGIGKDINNNAVALHFNYNLLEKVRVAPSYSFFFKKEEMKMQTFSLDFHYLFPEILSKHLPETKNQGICLYPIAGFLISTFSGPGKECSTCSVSNHVDDPNYIYNFGFNFGVGLEYKIPTLLPLLKDMLLNLEMKYQIVDSYERPLVAFGLMYNF